jgi:carboxylesterase type B
MRSSTDRHSTIWGESAGAGSVGIHAVAYGGRDDGLFTGIIGESGSPILLGPAYNLSMGQAIFDNISSTVGCTNSTDALTCLRSTDYETLNSAINITNAYRFYPYADGDMIQGSVYEQMLNGSFVKVPYLIGSTSDEGTAFGMRGINNDSDFRMYMASTGADEQSIAILEATYPNIPAIGIPETVTEPLNTTYGIQYKRSAAFGGDFAFTASRRLTNQQYNRYNTTSYAYRFNAIPYPLDNIVAVTHFQEVAFVFNNINGLGYAANPFQGKPPSYYTLSKLMSAMWASFIHDGNPNNHGQIGVPEWPAYENGPGGIPVSGMGGYGQTFVFQANGTGSYVEDDTYRAQGIAAINSMWGSQFGK